MLLKKLELKNFRQFRGEHVVEFSTDPKRNITLVIGLNTFGKSTLLNAINFALYGNVQPDFENPDQLLNSASAQQKGENFFEVKLEFEYAGLRYLIERKRSVLFHGGGVAKNQDSAKLFVIDKTGHWSENPNYQGLINRAIPPQMAPNFIFHGEKRVSLFQTGLSGNAVGKAIREVLGCNVVESAIEDLSAIVRDIQKNVAAKSGQNDLDNLEKSLEADQALLEENKQKIAEKEEKIAQWEARVQEISKALYDHEHTKEMQARINDCEAQIKRYEIERAETTAKRLDWFKANAAIALSAPLATAVLDVIDDEELKGNIPEPYNKDFIEKLLKNHRCICETPLPEKSKERDAVAKCLKDGGDKRIIDARSKTKAFADQLLGTVSSAKNVLISYETRLREIEMKIGQGEALLADLNERIKDVPVEKLNEIARSRDDLKKKIKEEGERIGNLKRKIQVEIEPRIKEKTEEFNRRTKDLPQLRRLNFIKEFVARLQGFLGDELAKYQQEATTRVLELTNASLGVMHRDKEAFFDDGMSLGLRDSKTKVVQGKSTGESQLLVLAFTSALISFCASRESDTTQYLTPGTVAPLVLDAPFGQLDSVFQEAAVSWMPKMARQLVLLVSDTQAKILLSEEETKKRIGNCYVIQLPPGERAAKDYQVLGHEYASRNSRDDGATTLAKVL